MWQKWFSSFVFLRQGLVLPKADPVSPPPSCLSRLITGASLHTWLSLNLFQRISEGGGVNPPFTPASVSEDRNHPEYMDPPALLPPVFSLQVFLGLSHQWMILTK